MNSGRGPNQSRSVMMVLANTFATDARVTREAKSLTRNGYDVSVLCWDRGGDRSRSETVGRVKVRNLRLGGSSVTVKSRVGFAVSALLFQAAVIIAVTRKLGGTRRLILHAHDFNTLPGSAICKGLYRGRLGLVYDSHELTPGVYAEWYGEPVARVVGGLERMLVGAADGVVAANSAITGYLSTVSATPAVAVYNCPEAFEVPKVTPAEAKLRLGLSGRFVVLFVGRVRQDYDIDMLVRASRAIRDSGSGRSFKFVFVGPSQTNGPLEKTVAAEGVADMFEFRSWVPYRELMLLYRASDLCFAVTRDLGLNTRVLTPIKVFESMACGLPVAVRSGTLAAQIVTQATSGITVDGAESGFARILMDLDEHPDTLRQLGEGGLKAFHDEYNWEQMEGRLLDLYGAVRRAPGRAEGRGDPMGREGRPGVLN